MFNKRKSLAAGRQGQSTVEYIVLVTAVLGVVIAFLLNPNSPFKTKLNATMDTVTSEMGNMATRFAGSHALTNQSSPAPQMTTNVIVGP